MTITVDAKRQVGKYLSAANNRAYNALGDAIAALQNLEGSFNAAYTPVTFKGGGLESGDLSGKFGTEVAPVGTINTATAAVVDCALEASLSNVVFDDSSVCDKSTSIAATVDKLVATCAKESPDAPEYASVTPVTMPPMPTPTMPPELGKAPTVNDPSFKSAPDRLELNDPSLITPVVPPAPSTQLPPFEYIRPKDDLPVIVNDFSWSEEAYTSEVLLQTESVIKEMLSGTTGIPDVIWDAIWQRDSDKEDKQGITLLREVRESIANLGFTLPQGPQLARELEIQTKIYEASNTRSRDIAIKQADAEMENLKAAVTHGLALENMLSTLYDKSLNRTFDAAKFLSELNIQLYNANLSRYKMQIDLYNADIEVYKAQLDTVKIATDLYIAEINAMSAISDYNKSLIAIYNSQVETYNIEVKAYATEISAEAEKINAQAENVKAFGEEVRAYQATIDAATSEYEGYKTAVQGVAAQSSILQANASIFSARVSSVKTNNDIAIDKANITLKEDELNLQNIQQQIALYSANIQKYTAEYEAENKAIGLTIQNKVAEYGRMDSIDKNKIGKYSADIQNNVNVTKVAISNAESNLRTLEFLDKQYADIALARAGINSDIGNAAMSAVNVSAGINDSASNSFEVASS